MGPTEIGRPMVTPTYQPGINRHPQTSTPWLVNPHFFSTSGGSELLTRHFVLAIRGFEAPTHDFKSPIRSFESPTGIDRSAVFG